MTKNDKIKIALEDLNARILAVDPTDSRRLGDLQAELDNLVVTIDSDSPAKGLLKMALTAMRVIQVNHPSTTDEILDAVSSALSAAVLNLYEPDDESHGAIATSATLIRNLLRSQDIPSAKPKECSPTVEAVDASDQTKESTEEASLLDDEPELLAEFIAESCDRISDAETALLALETNPDDREQIDTILRAFHTIKGASGFLGLGVIGQLAHHAENLLIQARDGEISMVGKHADLALRACDALRSMIEALPKIESQEVHDDSVDLEALLEVLVIDNPCDACEQADVDESEITESPVVCDDITPAALKSFSDSSVRVGTDRLDDLVDMVGELVIAHSQIAGNPAAAGSVSDQLVNNVSHMSKIIRELQDLCMSLRMIPLRPTFQKMARLVRDLSRKSGKAVQLVTVGEDTEIDRNMVEALSDPLIHMIRNAVDHGIESANERARLGKPAMGTITLKASHSAGNVVIEIHDDGKGLDSKSILDKGHQAGLIEPNHEPRESEIYSLIFHPGLSTARNVTDVSGRGVGMDVVKRNVDALRGRIEVSSPSGEGTTFSVHVPLTMAIADTMLFRVGSERYLLPTVSIDRSFRPAAGAVKSVAGKGEMVMFDGQALPVFRMHQMFDIPQAITDPSDALLVVVEGQGKRCALVVDELISQQQVVIKSLGQSFAGLAGVSGGAILGDGKVGLILDAGGLVELAYGHSKAA